jgi:hypothetical protein
MRVRYLVTMTELVKRRLGRVVVEDELIYRRELALLDMCRVDLSRAAASLTFKRGERASVVSAQRVSRVSRVAVTMRSAARGGVNASQ